MFPNKVKRITFLFFVLISLRMSVGSQCDDLSQARTGTRRNHKFPEAERIVTDPIKFGGSGNVRFAARCGE